MDIHDGYGQTETGALTGALTDGEVRDGSMGLPLPGIELRIDDGELRAPERRAARRSSATTSARSRTRRSGGGPATSSAPTSDGYLWFEGRSDDVILSSGYRIGPFEVESALLSHPAVSEAAAVAAPDPERGSVVRAVVVLRSGEPGDALAERAAGARQATDGSLQVPADRRVRRLAAEDRQRQDQAGRAAHGWSRGARVSGDSAEGSRRRPGQTFSRPVRGHAARPAQHRRDDPGPAPVREGPDRLDRPRRRHRRRRLRDNRPRLPAARGQHRRRPRSQARRDRRGDRHGRRQPPLLPPARRRRAHRRPPDPRRRRGRRLHRELGLGRRHHRPGAARPDHRPLRPGDLGRALVRPADRRLPAPGGRLRGGLGIRRGRPPRRRDDRRADPRAAAAGARSPTPRAGPACSRPRRSGRGWR